MDEMVLQAQKWVNATYRGVPGFNTVTEDGVTGWATMYALTRALQHELGITALSDSFGPATLAALNARGNIGPIESNTNIIKIVQSGCYCKGYNAGAINGVWGAVTSAAINALMENAGLGFEDGLLRPKVFKALLTMDAYVVVAGGIAQVRSVQQWINNRYFHRKNYFLIPCEGIFSRDVQKALYLAIQYELGMTDEQATGVFGPGTQDGLRANTLSTGSSGPFVQLFTASMIFNKVRNGTGARFLDFTGTFGSNVVDAVRVFQRFSELPVTGNGDFATWCQLLVSTGDPNRPGTAADCIETVTAARAQALVSAGFRVVGRYLDERPSTNPLNKRIQPGELSTIFGHGLRVFPISQYYGGEVGYFTYTQGFTDAVQAHDAAESYGFNAGVTIYFAVDYDATDPEITSNIIPYFDGVVAGLASRGKKYLHGVYGSRNVCTRVSRETYARWSFVSGMSTGFSGNMGFSLPDNWSFNQIQTTAVGSGSGRINIDKNIHKSGTDPGSGSVNSVGGPIQDFLGYVDLLYSVALRYSSAQGNPRPDPNRLVTTFMRHTEYNDSNWEMLTGPIDQNWINYAKSSGIQMIETFPDPFYGVEYKVRHFAVVAEGVYMNGMPGDVANRGDFCGWGGDWTSFYAEWRRDSDSYASGHDYCRAHLFQPGDRGSFKIRDLIEDADGFNIGIRLRNQANIAEELRNTLQGNGHLSRFHRFYTGRFGGSAATARSAAASMLLASTDGPLTALKNAVIQQIGGGVALPDVIPPERLAEFCLGFADFLLIKVGQEDAQRRLVAKAKGARQ
jgi:peptidoglycan hydrolase-like protein with peptidoglycan-binding domain